MPGFPGCSWCHGKGCMCCDGEQVKWEKQEAKRREDVEIQRARRTKAAETRRTKQLADPAFIAASTAKMYSDEARSVLRPEGKGFRYCESCTGVGCDGCDDAERRFVFSAICGAISWKWGNFDVRDIRDAVVRIEEARPASGLGAMTADEIESAFKPALDAEYKRQFPDGPKPIFSAKRNNPVDMAILNSFLGRKSLERVFADGFTAEAMAEIETLAATARTIQANPQGVLGE